MLVKDYSPEPKDRRYSSADFVGITPARGAGVSDHIWSLEQIAELEPVVPVKHSP